MSHLRSPRSVPPLLVLGEGMLLGSCRSSTAPEATQTGLALWNIGPLPRQLDGFG